MSLSILKRPSSSGSTSYHTPPPRSASMTQSASNSSSLFAEDYSLSSPASPASFGSPGDPPNLPSRSVTPNHNSYKNNNNGRHSLEVVFPPPTTTTTMDKDLSAQTRRQMQILTPPASPGQSSSSKTHFTPLPPPILKKKVSFPAGEHFDENVFRPTPSHSGQGIKGYKSYEGCMEGALGHDTKAATYKVGTEKAYHHLNRANELFASALLHRPQDKKAMLGRGKVLISLATDYQPPRVATASLREATTMLRMLVKLAPSSITARETLAQAAALLSSTLHDTEDNVEEEQKVWDGEIGLLAREALVVLEEVAADKMDRMRDMGPKEAAEQSPAMAETFIALSSAAITVSAFATSINTVDLHIELAEQALDQASNMATVAAAARIKSSTSSANLITRVQLASGRSSLERLRHTFSLGADLDEDDFRSLLADMSMLATECRERAAKLKGHKAEAASTLAWEAIKQLGDAKALYANLLRLVWRKRKPRRRMNGNSNSESRGSQSLTPNRKLSSRQGSVEATIQEEDEDGGKLASGGKEFTGRRESTSSAGSRGADNRKGSNLDAMPEGVEVSTFAKRRVSRASASRTSISVPVIGRRGSWLPTNGNGSNLGDAPIGRSRRLSSMSAPLIGPDGISAWNRRASVISVASDDEAAGLVPSSELARTAWQLLEGSIKQYKLALSVLTGSDLPNARLAQAKNETLLAIAYCSLFMASLAPRLSNAADKKTSLLVTAEVYSTWAAREVGWSFLIEGTAASKQADRRTNSWRADEAGKRAVMLLLRIWWHRAVTTESMDVETKGQAKDAVETVVKRMKDKEGVKDGDVARMRIWLAKQEGEMDTAESLFWRSASRILRGGSGFVMA